MDQFAAVLVIVAVLATWGWFLYKVSRGRMWSPLWLAFSTTAAAVLFLVAGANGYTLSKHARFVDGTSWSDAVIWWQVGVGLALLPLAAFFWRKGLRSSARNRPRHA
jgi:hypothetical protein